MKTLKILFLAFAALSCIAGAAYAETSDTDQYLQQQINVLQSRVRRLAARVEELEGTDQPLPANTASASFDGLQQYLTISDSIQSGLDIGGSFTFEAWIKPSALGSTMCIVCKWGGNGNLSYAFQVGPASKASRFTFSTNGLTPPDPSESSMALTINAWQHVAVTYDAITGMCVHYLNGIVNGLCKRGPGGPYNSIADVVLGASTDIQGLPTAFFSGLVDEVRVWSVARTSSEIASSFNQPLTAFPNTLLAYWDFEGGYQDKSIYENHLSSNGGVPLVMDSPF